MPKLVVEISEEEYNRIQNFDWDWKYADIWFSEEQKAIHNGKILPKGYGRLIDADELPISSIDITDLPYDDKGLAVVLLEDIECAPTVIEADRENTDGNK